MGLFFTTSITNKRFRCLLLKVAILKGRNNVLQNLDDKLKEAKIKTTSANAFKLYVLREKMKNIVNVKEP